MPFVKKPWGEMFTDDTDISLSNHGYKVCHRYLLLDPGASTSLQIHLKRKEILIPLNGHMVIDQGPHGRKNVAPQHVCYIHAKEMHQIINPNKHRLVISELRLGNYIADDDIIRVVDPYVNQRP